ncbi:MAG: hypothetical protein JSU73_09190 [candidate division WOR-3 bacterium]|nr:MAG: hypothetical protein JSU73_09190 [candidate division WOR-3 bacterium]
MAKATRSTGRAASLIYTVQHSGRYHTLVGRIDQHGKLALTIRSKTEFSSLDLKPSSGGRVGGVYTNRADTHVLVLSLKPDGTYAGTFTDRESDVHLTVAGDSLVRRVRSGAKQETDKYRFRLAVGAGHKAAGAASFIHKDNGFTLQVKDGRVDRGSIRCKGLHHAIRILLLPSGKWQGDFSWLSDGGLFRATYRQGRGTGEFRSQVVAKPRR